MPETTGRLAAAYRGWLDAQQQALALMEGADIPDHPEDRAEGYRWLTRIASLCQDWILEKEDPLHPTLFRSQGPARKLIVDNPDVDYGFASLDAGERYRLHGSRGGSAYMGFSIGTDIFRGAQGQSGTLGQHNADNFHQGPGGRLDLVLAREMPVGSDAQNWIPLPEGATQLAVRETFLDRTKETPSELVLECLGDPVPPPRAEPEVIAEKLETMSRFLLFVVNTCAMMWQGAGANTNRLVGARGRRHVEAQEDGTRTHSDADMGYMGGKWQLAPGQGLRVTVHPPDGDFIYWGLVIINPWMESHDYRYRRTRANAADAARNPDGSWRLTISPTDPGPDAGTWLDSGGRREGFMLLRWVLKDAFPPDPSCEIVAVD